MRKTYLAVPVIALVLTLGGCGKKAPPPPVPTDSGAQADEAAARARREAEERARLEAERARQEAEERARFEREMASARTTLQEMVFFDYDDARIKPEAQAILDAKVRVLRQYPEVRIRVEGHCDERGSNEYNDALGSRRAQSILDYLAGAGIQARRIEIVSFGEDRPLVTGSNEAAWARNRRGAFQVLSGLGG